MTRKLQNEAKWESRRERPSHVGRASRDNRTLTLWGAGRWNGGGVWLLVGMTDRGGARLAGRLALPKNNNAYDTMRTTDDMFATVTFLPRLRPKWIQGGRTWRPR